MTFEIPLSIIAQIIFYGMFVGIFFFTTKWIITREHDGYHFDIKKSSDFLVVLLLDGIGVLLLITGLHFGGLIEII